MSATAGKTKARPMAKALGKPEKAVQITRTDRQFDAIKKKGAIKRHRAAAREDFKSSMLRIRVKGGIKEEATATLEKLGISLPEAVRVFLGRIVSEKVFPFPLEVPNAETRAAMAEADRLSGRFATIEELFDDLEKGGAH